MGNQGRDTSKWTSISSSLGSNVFSTSSSNSRLINRNNSTIRMSNQLGVQVKGTRVAIAGSIGQRRSSKRGSSKDRCSSSISSSKSSNVISTGSSNSRLINRNNSTIRMSNQLGVQVEGTSITIAGSISQGRGNSS